MDRPLSLSVFLGLLQERLEAIPAQQLRAALLTHAKGLPSGQRAAFLAAVPQDISIPAPLTTLARSSFFFGWHPAFAWVPGNVRRLPLQRTGDMP